ncbi:hypothetical protein HOLleu_21828 [Holothuria leucospilota]|uniref:Retrotransposon gag domain-containing protein n=1 Tax=Holothuria leucospilota TaxID=206669 RepID=A0A9Q1BXS2_HOLLE|nr:hypothetical protein HOLleu_21828 [Holothuria leucospilota]
MCTVFIGTKRREIHETLKFEKDPEDRTVTDILKAFDEYCSPKTNRTVEQYKIFSCNQATRESLEQYITELKIRAATCNFATLHELLVKDKIVRGNKIHTDQERDVGCYLQSGVFSPIHIWPTSCCTHNHKLLEIIVTKPLHKAPKRLQKMLLRLQNYNTQISYKPGKTLYLAYTLSRAYLPNKNPHEISSEVETINSNTIAHHRTKEK